MHLAQSGFILGSQTTYNCIIALEMIHLINRKRGKNGLMAVKKTQKGIWSSQVAFHMLYSSIFFIFPSK